MEKQTKPGNGRLLAAVATLLAAAFVLAMIFLMPDLDRVNLIRAGREPVSVMELAPGEVYTQPVYVYKAFDQLVMHRAEAEEEAALRVAARQEDRVLFAEEFRFEAGQEKQEIALSGGKGVLLLTLENQGDSSILFPMADASCYDTAEGLEGETPVLQLEVYRYSAAAKGSYAAVTGMLVLLALGLLFSEGKGQIRRRAMVFLLILCAVYTILFPAWNINDFHTHFMTAYSDVNSLLGLEPERDGHLMVRQEDAWFFAYVFKDRYQSFYQPTNRSYDDAVSFLFQRSEQNEMVPYPGYSLARRENGMYNYIPAILAILMGRALSLNLVTIALLARVLGIVIYLAVIWLALRKLPEKMVLPVAILAGVPASAMNLTAVSYDPVCFVVILFFFSYMLALWEQFRWGDAWALAIASLALGMVKKGACAPLAVSLLMLFCGTDRRKKLWAAACAALAAAGMVFCYRNLLLGRGNFSQLGSMGDNTYYAKWAIEHPLGYLQLMARTYLRQTDKYAGAVGRYLGWNKAALPEFICVLFYGLLGIASALPGEKGTPVRRLSRYEKFWLWVPVLLMVLILPATVLSFTFVTMDTIDGLQGRYFLPLLIPVLILLCDRWSTGAFQKWKDSGKLLWGAAFLTLCSVYYIGVTFLSV